MSLETIRLRLTGQRRLVMHSGRLADPIDPVARNLARLTSKRMKTEADHEEISRLEWHGGLWLADGLPCIPREALMATFVAGAKTRRRGDPAKVGLIIEDHAPLKYDGPADLDELWKDKRFVLRVGVKLKGARCMRTRPCFDDWSVDFTARYFTNLFSRQQILELYAVAGFEKGIGDWRPQHGNYSVTALE